MNRHALKRFRTSAMQTFASAFVLGKKDGSAPTSALCAVLNRRSGR